MCSICELKIEFSVDHPLSLAVAVETRGAVDAGLLPEPDMPDDPLGAVRLRAKAIDTLKTVQQRLERALRPEELLALPDFFVLMIESRTWGFFHPTSTGFDPNCRPEPPNVSADDAASRDAVLVASELALSEVVAGRLPFDEALERRILAFDADSARYRLLMDAWSRAYPVVGFSRFVCA